MYPLLCTWDKLRQSREKDPPQSCVPTVIVLLLVPSKCTSNLRGAVNQM